MTTATIVWLQKKIFQNFCFVWNFSTSLCVYRAIVMLIWGRANKENVDFYSFFISSHTLSPILREWGLKLKFPSLPAALPVCEFFHILSVVVVRGRCRDSATIWAQLDVGGWLAHFSSNEFFLSCCVISSQTIFSSDWLEARTTSTWRWRDQRWGKG